VSANAQDTTVTLHDSGPTTMNLNGWTLLIGPAFYIGLTGVSVGSGQNMTLAFHGWGGHANRYISRNRSSVVTSALDPRARVVLVAPGNQAASLYSMS
jgi:hypothetical protein